MANLTVEGKVYEIVPDLIFLDGTNIESCWECDLAKLCIPTCIFCRKFMYRVHFKLATNDSK